MVTVQLSAYTLYRNTSVVSPIHSSISSGYLRSCIAFICLFDCIPVTLCADRLHPLLSSLVLVSSLPVNCRRRTPTVQTTETKTRQIPNRTNRPTSNLRLPSANASFVAPKAKSVYPQHRLLSSDSI